MDLIVKKTGKKPENLQGNDYHTIQEKVSESRRC